MTGFTTIGSTRVALSTRGTAFIITQAPLLGFYELVSVPATTIQAALQAADDCTNPAIVNHGAWSDLHDTMSAAYAL